MVEMKNMSLLNLKREIKGLFEATRIAKVIEVAIPTRPMYR